MSRSAYTKSQIFLLEFIIVVLFFAICATVTVSAFVKADRLSETSRDQNRMMIEMQSVAECLKAIDAKDLQGDPVEGAYAELEALYAVEVFAKNEITEGNKLPVYFDGNFNQTSADDRKYTMYIGLEYQDNMLTASLTSDVMADDMVLTVKKHIPNKE